MKTELAFAKGDANRGQEMKIFDWEKAAQIIRDKSAKDASAGLDEDWEWTGGDILENGEPDNDSYTYLGSTWATPVLRIGDESIDCFRMQSDTPGWDEKTKWPESALAILKAA